MLIDGFDLEILTPPCEPGADRFFIELTEMGYTWGL